MSTTFAGHYPLENRAGEIERLRIQGEGMAPDALTMLSASASRPAGAVSTSAAGPAASLG